MSEDTNILDLLPRLNQPLVAYQATSESASSSEPGDGRVSAKGAQQYLGRSFSFLRIAHPAVAAATAIEGKIAEDKVTGTYRFSEDARGEFTFTRVKRERVSGLRFSAF